MLSGANYAVPLFRQYSCKIQPPPQHGTTRVASCIGLKPETCNYSLLSIKRLVSCNSFCKRRTCSANCSWLGRASLILMLLYVATPIGVLMPLNDHWTSILCFIISPNLCHAGKPAIWYHSAYDAPRRRNIFRASDSPSCKGNLCGYEGKTYYDSSFSSLFWGFLNRLTALSKSLSNILISRSR